MTDYSIFFIIAVAATGVGALLFLLSLFGLGEHDLDFDADAGGADVGLLSIKSGIGFFLGFGWGGVLAQGLGWGMAASLAAAFFTGVLMFLIIGISMRFIMSLKSDGTLNYETLKGMHGTVYLVRGTSSVRTSASSTNTLMRTASTLSSSTPSGRGKVVVARFIRAI